MRGRVLIIAGSDSSGGAGIQADIKTVTALGGYAATAVTAVTAQDTTGVHGVVAIDPDFVARQIELVLKDIGADCIKIGMLHDAAVIEAVSDRLERDAAGVPVVLDPVMAAKGGHRLLAPDAVAALKRRLVLHAAVITPNLPEAEVLTGRSIATHADMREAAYTLPTLGCNAALLKGGHLAGPVVRDILVEHDHVEEFEAPRIETRNTHGTGCTLASAIAAGIAQGLGLRDSVVRARAFVREAIRTAPGLGHGHGPLNHAHTVAAFPVA